MNAQQSNPLKEKEWYDKCQYSLKRWELNICSSTDLSCKDFLMVNFAVNAFNLNPFSTRQVFFKSETYPLSWYFLFNNRLHYNLIWESEECVVVCRLRSCGVTDEGCAALASALRSNPEHMKELDLSWNKIGDPGVKLLSAGLEDPHCKLEKLE